jgi:TonB-dependent receptor
MSQDITGGAPHSRLYSGLKRGFGASASVLVLGLMAQPTFAQDSSSEDEVIAVGTRQVIQDTIALKRNSTQIVDGLSADEIGDIPALSLGEALEGITGVASHRENGGATEVSIRGLGPYLSSTVINGRLVGNGSGDRSVNFSQFPSELVNKLAVFKTQDASQIEGGVAGQIQIDTLKPLDFGKRRIQAEIKGNINPDQLNQEDTQVGDIGYRGTLSYVDQFEVGGGDIGFSIGGQVSKISQPEAEIRSTSNFGSSSFACIVRPNPTDELGIGFTNNPIESNRDCEDYRAPNNQGGDNNNIGVVTSNEPTGDDRLDAINFGSPFVLVPSQRHYRQNDTQDARDALFGTLQWQPNDRWDINLDAQWSKRTQSEERNDLTFNGWKRNDSSLGGIPGFDSNPSSVDLLRYRANGGIISATTENTIEVQGGNWEREETFQGFGLNGSYDVSERLTVSADVAYSKVERTEQAVEFRIQSDKSPTIQFDTASGIPLYTLYDEEFDVNDHDNYVDRLRVRIDNDLERENSFTSGRLDFDYKVDKGVFTTLQTGLRFGRQDYISTPGGSDTFSGANGRTSFEIENDGEFTFNGTEIVDDDSSDAEAAPFVNIIAATNEACRGQFPETDFLSNLRGSNELVTQVDSDGNVTGATSSWGVFDAQCVADTSIAALNQVTALLNQLSIDTNGSNSRVLGAISGDIPTLSSDNSRTTNVQEDTLALYAMANYETTFDSLPLRGNFGMRVVNTEVTSRSFRQGYEISEDGGEFTIAEAGDAIPVSTKSDYTNFLPSANAILEIADDKLLRFGVFKAISRADPADMGFSRSFSTQNEVDGEPITNRNDLIQSVNASGSPAIGPLTSWNYDIGFEWYPNKDSIFAIGSYYKKFDGQFENVTENETFVVDGQDITRAVSGLQEVAQEGSGLVGFEVTGSHRFSYLPGYLSGLGVKASYNYASSDFEFEDSLYGDVFERDINGNLIQTNTGIVAPGGLPGLSENTFSGTVYYQIGGLDVSAIYKYRDNYFQPATSNGTRLRYIGEVGVLEARASYKINDNFRVSVEAINLLDAEKEQFQWVEDNQYEVNSYGPRVFFGVRGRF